MKRLLFAVLLLTRITSALELPATDGKTIDPAAAGDKKAVVLFFVSPFCSTTKSFMKEINQIAADSGDKAVVYLVHSDPEITKEVALEHAILSEVKATVLLDQEQTFAN
jgi:thiol-disulfide isomerase/thioredoxin